MRLLDPNGRSSALNVREDGVVAAAQTGDESAFAALVEHYRRELQVHCYRMLGSFEESEDMVQETFLRAWKNLSSFEGRSTLRAWLYRIATNACLDFLDGKARRILPYELVAPSEPTDEQDPRTALTVMLAAVAFTRLRAAGQPAETQSAAPPA